MRLSMLDNHVKAQFRNRPLFAVFDRDGTLAPISLDPDNAPVTTEARNLLQELSLCSNVTVALVSARSCRQLREDVGDNDTIVAGNYGMEIIAPNHGHFIHPKALAASQKLSKMRQFLTDTLSPDKEIIVEDHGLSLCVHWHLARLDIIEKVLLLMEKLKSENTDLWFRRLPTSMEILPPFEWNKAMAMDQMLTMIENNEQTGNWFYFFAGDSILDEPLFEWVNAQGGISIKVGRQEPSTAQYAVDSPSELLETVSEMVALRQIN